MDDLAETLVIFGEFGIRRRCSATRGYIETGERTDAENAIREAKLLEIGRLQEGMRYRRLADELLVVLRGHPINDDLAC